MKTKFNIINKTDLYSGFFKLHKITLKHQKHDGSWTKTISREIFGGAHVATVIPYDPKTKKIVLIEQFRSGILNKDYDPVLKEVVAGMIDKGETPEEAAIRECKEETNCNILKIKKILNYFPAPGSSESYYHLFLGEINSFEGERLSGLNTENEDIVAKCYSYSEVKKFLKNNHIINGLTLIALQWFFLNIEKNY